MAVQQSVLQMVETPPPAKGKLPGSGQSSAEDMRKFEREMDKVQTDQQSPRKADQTSAPSKQNEAQDTTRSNGAGQSNINPDQNAQKAEPNGKNVATDQSTSVEKPSDGHPAQASQNPQTTKSEVPAEIASLTNWHILEQAANKRDPKDKTSAVSLMDGVSPQTEGETTITGRDNIALADVAAQIKSIGNASTEKPIENAEGETNPQLAKQVTDAGEEAKQGLDAAPKEGKVGKDTAIAINGNNKPVINTEAASTKAVSETGLATESEANKASQNNGQSEQIASGPKADGRSIAAEQASAPDGEAVSHSGDENPEGLSANLSGEEDLSVSSKAQEPAQQPVQQDTKALASDVKQSATQFDDATKLTNEQIAKAEPEPEASQPATSAQPQNAQATTDIANQSTRTQSEVAQSSSESAAPATQSKEALAAQRAASDPDLKQAASQDTPSDATKSETRAEARSDKAAPTVNDRQEQLAKLRSPKGAIFSELMAGVKAAPNQMANLDGANDLFDPTVEMDLSTSMSQDRSVRLTGFDAFAKTGNLPTSTSLANAQAIAAQISRHVRGGENRFEIRLDPAELGKIDVRLTIGSDGQARAHLFVERPETMDFLMRDQRMLERTLQQSGLQLEDQGLEFSLMDHGDQNQQWSDQQNQSDDDIFSSSSDTANNTTGGQDEPVNGTLAQTYVATDGVNLVI